MWAARWEIEFGYGRHSTTGGVQQLNGSSRLNGPLCCGPCNYLLTSPIWLGCGRIRMAISANCCGLSPRPAQHLRQMRKPARRRKLSWRIDIVRLLSSLLIVRIRSLVGVCLPFPLDTQTDRERDGCTLDVHETEKLMELCQLRTLAGPVEPASRQNDIPLIVLIRDPGLLCRNGAYSSALVVPITSEDHPRSRPVHPQSSQIPGVLATPSRAAVS